MNTTRESDQSASSAWTHTSWYALAAILLFTILSRLLALGAAPLSDYEAAQAVKFLPGAAGISAVSSEPLYHLLTNLLVSIFPPTNTLVRFIPALVGIMLVFVPILYREYLGERTAIVMAAILALDPALVFQSRTAGGVLFGLLFGSLAILCLLKRKPASAGGLAGLCLISSSSIWLLLLPVIGLAALSAVLIKKRGADGSSVLRVLTGPRFWLAFGLSILLGSTAFFTQPAGIGAIVTTVVGFFQRFTVEGGLTLPTYGIGLLVYYLPVILLAGWGIVRGLLDGLVETWFLLCGLIFSLILIIFLPSRQLPDIFIANVPLDILAAKELSRHLNLDSEDKLPVLGVVALVATVCVFGYLSIARLTYTADLKHLWLALAGAAAILLLSAILIWMGWSQRIARRGFFWGLLLVLTLASFATAWRVTGIDMDGSREMMGPTSSYPQLELLRQTITDINKQNLLADDQVNVAVAGIHSDSLTWQLRDFTALREVTSVEKDALTDYVITSPELEVSLADAYRGQEFTLAMSTDWERYSVSDWIAWIVQRKVLTSETKCVLWVRADLFPGSNVNTSNP
jgi:hypothetical protein